MTNNQQKGNTDMKQCEQDCGRQATVYGGGKGAGDWAGYYCDQCLQSLGFIKFNDLNKTYDPVAETVEDVEDALPLLAQRIQRSDWDYDMSDDPRSYQSGWREEKEIVATMGTMLWSHDKIDALKVALVKEVFPSGVTDNDRFVAVCHQRIEYLVGRANPY